MLDIEKMQHTEVLELNSCITYLRTGKEASRSGRNPYDMTWTFTAPRDPAITELFVGSPGDDVWQPTAADLRADQQRRMKEREEEARRAATPRPAAKQNTNGEDGKNAVTPIPLSGLKAPLEFKKKPVAQRAQAAAQQKSLLSAGLSAVKRQGGIIGATPGAMANPNVPSVKLTIYLPDRRPLEIHVAKTATVEQAIVAVLERSRDKFGKRKPERYEMRMHDSDGLPDDDFPALDRASVISEMGSNEFCLCDLKGGDDDTDDERDATPAPTPPPAQIAATAIPLTRTRAVGERKANQITVCFDDLKYTKLKKTEVYLDKDTTALGLLKKVVGGQKEPLPILAEEYQLRVSDTEMERLGMLVSVLRPEDDLLALGIKTVFVCTRKYKDTPLDGEKMDKLKTNMNQEAKKANQQRGEMDQARKDDVNAGGAGNAGAAKNGPQVTIKDTKSGVMTPLNVKSKDGLGSKSTGKSSAKANAKTKAGAAEPDPIIMNELKAAMYEEYPVTKTNNWGKNQQRMLGIDAHKLYNKARSEGGFGGSVKHAERLIADVIHCEVNPNNPKAFSIKVREPLGNNTTTLNYEAQTAEDAAKIVAKIKYNNSGQVTRN